MDWVHLKGLKRNRANLIKAIRSSEIEFDVIAFRGWSGGLVAPSVALTLRKEFVLVRKNHDYEHDSHANSKCEGHVASGLKYIVIDDFVGSGATVQAIHETLSAHQMTLVGIFLYKRQSRATYCLSCFMRDCGCYLLNPVPIFGAEQ